MKEIIKIPKGLFFSGGGGWGGVGVMKIEFCTRWGLSFNSIMNSNHVTSKIRLPLFAHSSCLPNGIGSPNLGKC